MIVYVVSKGNVEEGSFGDEWTDWAIYEVHSTLEGAQGACTPCRGTWTTAATADGVTFAWHCWPWAIETQEVKP